MSDLLHEVTVAWRLKIDTNDFFFWGGGGGGDFDLKFLDRKGLKIDPKMRIFRYYQKSMHGNFVKFLAQKGPKMDQK